MLLEDLLKHTKPEHADYAALQQARDKMKEVADYVNDKKKEAENHTMLLSIQEKLTGKFEVRHREFARTHTHAHANARTHMRTHTTTKTHIDTYTRACVGAHSRPQKNFLSREAHRRYVRRGALALLPDFITADNNRSMKKEETYALDGAQTHIAAQHSTYTPTHANTHARTHARKHAHTPTRT